MAFRVPTLYRQLFKHRNLATMSSRDWIRGPGPYSVYTKPIKRGELDEREYRYIRLENGLQALLVSDPDVDMAAASLDVAVGHLADPVRHFPLVDACANPFCRLTCMASPISVNICSLWCASVFFPVFHSDHTTQGTEKFPRANEYSEVCCASQI